MTNWSLVEGQWDSLTAKVKTRWGKLSAADIQGISGKRSRLVAKLQESYNIFQLEAENQVNRWATKLGLATPAPPPADSAVSVDTQAVPDVSNGVVVAAPEAEASSAGPSDAPAVAPGKPKSPPTARG